MVAAVLGVVVFVGEVTVVVVIVVTVVITAPVTLSSYRLGYGLGYGLGYCGVNGRRDGSSAFR